MKFSQLYRKQLRTVFSGNKYTPDSTKEAIAKSIGFISTTGERHTLHDELEAKVKFMETFEKRREEVVEVGVEPETVEPKAIEA